MPRASRTPARRPSHGLAGTAVLAALVAVVLAACTGGTLDGPAGASGGSATPAVPEVRAEVTVPDTTATVVRDAAAAPAALAASRALFRSAPVVVLAATDDPAHVGPAATTGVVLGAPVLVGGTDGDLPAAALADELDRLGSTDLVVVGDPPDGLPDGVRVHAVDPADPAAGFAALGIAVGAAQDVDAARLTASVAALGRPAPALLVGQVTTGGGPASTGRGPAASPSPGTTAGSAATADATAGDAAAGDATAGDAARADVTSADAARADVAMGSVPWPALTLGPSTAPTAGPGSPESPASPRTARAPQPAGRDTTGPSAPAASGAPARLGGDGPVVLPPEQAPAHTAVLVDLAAADAPAVAPAVATARAAGIPVVDVPGGDPRATSATVEALTGVRTVVALGPSFGDPERLGARLAAVATGVELPGGGQLVFPAGAPGKRYIALYGTPGTPSLGVLGEQDVPATIARAAQTAAPYADLTEDTVVPTLEIIATIASAGPEPDGSYSRPRSVEDLRPLVEAAGDAGMAVVLDLQPGRTDFVTQAQQFAELLAYPHVGLALDPEWRLAPDQVHLRQIGSVGIDEVNATADWLADFTRERHLPQKMFLLHQFSLRMITDRERLDTSHDELAMIIHADGQGTQPAKADTWRALHQGAPAVHWGWKNFYDEDTPMLDPAQTYAVQPVPDLVTYQ